MTNQNINDDFQEGEIIEEQNTSVTEVTNSQTQDFLNLEELIKRYVGALAKLNEDLKKNHQMFEDAFENDAVYREHAEKAKEANRIKSATKQQILKQPAMQELNQKVKDLRFEVKENQALLSDYLSQYQKATGATQIELEDGEVLEIVSQVRLVKRFSKDR